MSESHTINQGRGRPGHHVLAQHHPFHTHTVPRPCPPPCPPPSNCLPASFSWPWRAEERYFYLRATKGERRRRSPLSIYLARGRCLLTVTNHNEATPLARSVEKSRVFVFVFIRRSGAAVKNSFIQKSSGKEAQGQPFLNPSPQQLKGGHSKPVTTAPPLPFLKASRLHLPGLEPKKPAAVLHPPCLGVFPLEPGSD